MINAQSWIERKRVFDANASHLLHAATEPIFAALQDDNAERPSELQQIRTIVALTAMARQHGPDAAFVSIACQFAEQIRNNEHGLLDHELEAVLHDLCQLAESIAPPADNADRNVWGALQLNLGNLLRTRDGTSIQEASIRAIGCYKRALSVFTRESAPEHWAGVQRMLGNTFITRQDDRNENLKKAIGHFEKAREVETLQTSPSQWLHIHDRMGLAWRELANQDRAIECYRFALQCPREHNFKQWFDCCFSLAQLLQTSSGADHLRHIEESIDLFELTSPESDPRRWGNTLRNLGEAWRQVESGVRADNIERAIQ